MKTEWISVNDKLPENDKPVLTYCHLKPPGTWPNYHVNFYFKGWFIQDEYITHWMTLPPPPKP